MRRYLLDSARPIWLHAGHTHGNRPGATVDSRGRGDHEHSLRRRSRRILEELLGLLPTLAGNALSAHQRSPLPTHLRNCPPLRDLRRALRPPHGPAPIGDIDTLIAATALEHVLAIVTTDRDYVRVPGLTVRLLPPGALRSVPPAPWSGSQYTRTHNLLRGMLYSTGRRPPGRG